jgi:2-keto-3-deoxy-L-rhamnonate aldolase RhmA
MDKDNDIREAVLSGRVTLGSWLQAGPYPALAEIMADTGFDWLAVDLEHSDIDVEGMTSLFRGMKGRGAAPLARVRENDTLAIRQALDAGAEGVIVPLVNSAAEARKAVAAAKYPPMGVRGFCFARMNRFGRDFDDYAKNANDRTLVIVMIESKTAVENIEEILSVDGVDGVFIGPYDMSGSYGIIGQTEHPLMLEARRKILSACKAKNKAAGLHIVYPDGKNVKDAADSGFTFIALGVDMVFLRAGANSAFMTAKSIQSSQK